MKATKLTLKGRFFWAQVFEDNRDMTGPIDKSGVPYQPDIQNVNEGMYKIAVELDDDSIAALKTTDSQVLDNKRDGPDGETIYTFKRMHKKFSRAGALLDFASGPPKVMNAEGRPWTFEDEGEIFNGSEGEIVVDVYGEGRFCGTRLDSVKVTRAAPNPNESEKEEGEVPF